MTKTSSKYFFNEDTLKFKCCNNCDTKSPIVEKPTLTFYRFHHDNNEGFYRKKQEFNICFSVKADTSEGSISSIEDYEGKWRPQRRKNNSFLVLKRIVTFYDTETEKKIKSCDKRKTNI